VYQKRGKKRKRQKQPFFQFVWRVCGTPGNPFFKNLYRRQPHERQAKVKSFPRFPAAKLRGI
jgi:hypothetical protein